MQCNAVAMMCHSAAAASPGSAGTAHICVHTVEASSVEAQQL